MKPVAKSPILLGIIGAALIGGSALAEPVSVSGVLTPQESIKFELGDGSKHFVLAVRREGILEGTGPFAGAAVTEIGWHDVNPPLRGDPRGYLQVRAANGDIAVLEWAVQAVFVRGADKPALVNSGTWKLVSGTGAFAGMTGLGSVVLEPAGGPTKFTLTGQVGESAVPAGTL